MSIRTAAEVEQDALFSTSAAGPAFANPTFAGGVVSLRASRAESPALSISRENGLAVGGLYRRRWELNGAGWADEWRGNLNTYLALPLPGFARWVLAGRVAGAMSGGPNGRRFAIGGESGDVLGGIGGFGLGASHRDFPLRGYPPNNARFTRAVIGTVELRMPLMLVGRGIWKLPIALDRVSLTAFGEVGGGWRAGLPRRLADYRDVGSELVVDLGADRFRLRVRAGVAWPLTDGLAARRGEARGYVVLGPSF